GLQLAVLDDPGELGDTRLVGGKLQQRMRAIAVDQHFMHGAYARAIEPFPYSQAIQERGAPRTDGIDATIPSIAGGNRRLRFYQSQLEPGAAQRHGEACAHETGADNDDIEVHGGILNAKAATKRNQRKDETHVRAAPAR